ncbi:MAG TPA: response regulator, partial [bacterium]|nr:response regulator [bacterium]
RLRQIMVNLLANAVKFTERGEVVLAVTVVAGAGDAPLLRCSVRDSGIGIPPEILPKLFSSFTQADTSTTRRFGGSGLGLAICKRLVELMHGTIAVRSTPGTGSEFSFTVPLQAAPATTVPTWHHGGAALQGRTALIADSQELSRRLLQRRLTHWQMAVACCSTADELLAAVRHQPPAVIILDTALPGRDIPALLAELDTLTAGSKIPVVLLGMRGERMRDAAHCAGMLTRPVKPGLLHELFLQILTDAAPVATARAAVRFDPQWAAHYPLRLLVAEDNAINRTVIGRMLDKLGYRPVIVSDGEQAVAAVRTGDYDLVLMDAQMPVLDGLAATRRIRSTAERQPVIVAVTAGIAEEEQRACREAGMDDYLAKPIQPAALQEMLRCWQQRLQAGPIARAVTPAAPAAVGPQPNAAASAPAVLVPDSLQEMLTSGPDGIAVVRELIDLFLRETPETLARMQLLSVRGEADELGRSAHALKGACGVMGAREMQEYARQLEECARGQRLPDAALRLTALQAAWQRASARLRALRAAQA